MQELSCGNGRAGLQLLQCLQLLQSLQLLQLKKFCGNHFNDWINVCIARHCFMTPQTTTITTQ